MVFRQDRGKAIPILDSWRGDVGPSANAATLIRLCVRQHTNAQLQTLHGAESAISNPGSARHALHDETKMHNSLVVESVKKWKAEYDVLDHPLCELDSKAFLHAYQVLLSAHISIAKMMPEVVRVTI